MYAGLPGEFSRDHAKKLNWSKLYDHLEATESIQCEDNKPHKVNRIELTKLKSAHNNDDLLNAKELLDGLVANLVIKVLNSRNLLGSAFVDVFCWSWEKCISPRLQVDSWRHPHSVKGYRSN